MSDLDLTSHAPLMVSEDGTIRIAGSRVNLETIIYHFKQGATAEQIQEDFPSLSLREIYGAIFYYLEHTTDFEEYAQRQEAGIAETRRLIETCLKADNGGDLRERLRVRRGQTVKQ
ncbi:MAG: DUF433 domain-containing protein [Pyrinomonadaceae bacterium MAG19_C2-C3]|nr:DUF433 domain-containing protein [Pyrinomonadaceae bacterium MAG19_C2-C3]